MAVAKKKSTTKKRVPKKAPAKKTTVKKTTAKKAPAKRTVKKPKSKSVKAKNIKNAPVKMKAKGLTDTDQVLKIIKRSKKGVAVATLRNKTGFNDKKISNIVYRAFSAGKIKRVDIGIYKAA